MPGKRVGLFLSLHTSNADPLGGRPGPSVTVFSFSSLIIVLTLKSRSRFQFYRFHSVTGLTPATSKNLPRNCSLEWSVRCSRDWCAIDRLAQRSRSFSALGDQRAEILPVQRPLALAVGTRSMMRLPQILIFPFFSPGILDQLPLNRGYLPERPDANKRYSLRDRPSLSKLPWSSFRLPSHPHDHMRNGVTDHNVWQVPRPAPRRSRSAPPPANRGTMACNCELAISRV